MSSTTISTDSFKMSTCVVQQEEPSSLHSLLPFAAGYTAPPPTPLASIPPPLLPSPDSILAPPPPPLQTPPACFDLDTGDKNSFPSSSANTASPPSKADLDALAQYLMHHSLHSTPNLLAAPTLQRKRRTSMNAAAATVPHINEKELHVSSSSRNYITIGEGVRTFDYAGGFCDDSRREIEEASQDVGAFYVAVQDAEEALTMLRGRWHDRDKERIVEAGLISISQLLTSTSQHHQHDMLDPEPIACDTAGVDANTRDTMAKFARLSLRISKELLRILLKDLSIETQASIRGHSLKALLYIHANGRQELNVDDDVVLLLSHDIDIPKCDKSALFLARLGTQLQAWSEGKYKAPFLRSSSNNGNGEVCIQFALIQHH